MRHPTPAPFAPPFWLELVRHPRLVLLLDLDGTLIPFAETADLAVLDGHASELLAALAASGIQVVIVTGRSLSSAEKQRVAAGKAWWVAEHGLWRRSDGDWMGPTETGPEVETLIATLSSLLAHDGVRLERKTLGACVHWRAVSAETRDAAITAAELACDEWLESHSEFERIDGVDLIEVRHRSATKASAVAWVRDQIPDAHLLAIGDDDTDEDMFAELGSDELAIAVRNFRSRRTRARAWLSTPSAVREFLGWIVSSRASDDNDELPPLEVSETRTTRSRASLLVVSNRAPTVIPEGRRRQVSGLVSALEPALQTQDGMWLGWSGREHEGSAHLLVEDDLQPARASFDLRPAWRKHFYDGFCNRALWPLLHSFPERVRCSDADWGAYVEVNDVYARHAHELVESDGTVWVHDYHLLLMARALRQHHYTGKVGLFLHVPFPSPDVFETLPSSDELIAAMCEFDLLGFHTDQWADNFRACVRALDRRSNMLHRLPDIGVHPIGVDAQRFSKVEDAADQEILGLRATLGPRRMILGVDRLDYAKGIPHRLRAFAKLLERSPAWCGHVSFLQISVPTRVEVPEYADLRHEVENLVGQINGRFGEADWVPVRYLYRSYDHRVLAQLYRSADVALVTPLRDGMNLVAKEFIAAQDPSRPGVLVLSQFAGAAAQLTQAVITNPYHPEGMAIDLDRALRMPLEERRARHAQLAGTVQMDTPAEWADLFLHQLRTRPSA